MQRGPRGAGWERLGRAGQRKEPHERNVAPWTRAPGALRLYGIPENAYSSEAEMFALMHAMRVRVITAPSFTGDKVLGSILFERTMDGEAQGKPVPSYLWEDRGCVPFLKVDKGLEAETDGVSLMKPIPGLDTLLDRAVRLNVFGTKMRSTIHLASETGIAAIARQQFEIGAQIARHGLVPILEPEVLIKSPDKPKAEALLRDALARHLDALPSDQQVMLKVTIPDTSDLYKDLIAHDRVLRVVALSGGYTRADACQRLACNHGMIASFSRALLEELRASMSDTAFNAALAQAIEEIYTASTVKS
jgi:fructose-bisphosphate aldolase class I